MPSTPHIQLMKTLKKYKLAHPTHLWEKQHKIPMTWNVSNRLTSTHFLQALTMRKRITFLASVNINEIFLNEGEILGKTKTRTLVLTGEGVLKKISSPAPVPMLTFTTNFLKKAIYSLSPHPLELPVKVINNFHVAKFNSQFLVLLLSCVIG